MCRNLIESALHRVRKRFMDHAIARFPKGSSEYDIVSYKAQSLFKETVFGGKYSRAQLCIRAMKAMSSGLDEHRMALFEEVASTIEIEQTFFLIADDIMDGSEMRRGKTCWYKRPEIGMNAINDCFLLESFIEDIMRDILIEHPNLDRICEAYRRSKRITLIGQLLDTSSVKNLDYFNWQRYELLVEHKTSHYSFFNPLELALLLSDYLGHHILIRDIAYKIGFLFQAQDDMLDVYGDPNLTGKIGTDIQDGKCTWPAVRALQKLQQNKNEHLAVFKKSFGKADAESIEVVKKIYDQLRLQEEFAKFEKHLSEQIIEAMKNLPAEMRPLSSVLEETLSSLSNRKK